MKQSIKHLLGGALLLALPLFLTSCDDILGEWSKPTPAVVTPEPEAPVKVTSLTLNKATTWMLIGGSETLNVTTVDPDNATDKSVTWSSDKTSVATVDENTGAINGVAPGTAKITATAKDGSGVTATCTVIVGLLSGKFKINAAGNQIQFAQGNLQAKTEDLGVSWTWTLATNQWDYVGNIANNKINGNGTVSQNGTVDLFGWVGESNTTWEGDLGTKLNAAMYGISNVGNDGNLDFNTSTNDYGNVASENLKSDWGNTIGTSWRTLTKEEWVYLLDTRSGSTVNGTANARFTEATINTDGTAVNGIILFPDGKTIENGEATSWGTINGFSDWGTKCTSAQWTALAAKDCVFLPAAGHRWESTVSNVTERGRYWSSTVSGPTRAYYVRFRSNGGDYSSGQGNRCNGCSVRLVYPAQ